jgi:rubrerythrin
MTQRWTLDDIPWHRFDPSKVDARLLAVVKTASLVEANAADYVRYLHNIFPDDAAFRAAADQWGEEEAQHGAALARWAELADASFSFDQALATFRKGFSLDLDTAHSIRGSLAGELIARQVVETGTSSFYSAIRDAADEPVLKIIAGRIASDEYFHYRLFAQHGHRYLQRQPMSRWQRLKIALSRMNEAEDDELAYAYYAANLAGKTDAPAYSMKRDGRAYWTHAMALYRRPHIDTAVRMVLRAAELKPNGWLAKLGASLFWSLVRWRTASLARAA